MAEDSPAARSERQERPNRPNPRPSEKRYRERTAAYDAAPELYE